MASITEVRLIDDLDGSEADETVVFAFDGKNYDIDLAGKHAEKLRDILAPYVRAARRTGGSPTARRRRSTTTTATRREDTSAVREWANANGFEVSSRGRIPSSVTEAYENRGSAEAAQASVVEEKPRRRSRAVADPFGIEVAS